MKRRILHYFFLFLFVCLFFVLIHSQSLSHIHPHSIIKKQIKYRILHTYLCKYVLCLYAFIVMYQGIRRYPKICQGLVKLHLSKCISHPSLFFLNTHIFIFDSYMFFLRDLLIMLNLFNIIELYRFILSGTLL